MDINSTAHKEKMKEFRKSSGKLLGTKSETLIEKDLYLTLILKELRKIKFHENLVFRGGTCLAKAYLNYHRFSEDLDFTWRDQKNFEGKSTEQIRKICSEPVNDVGATLLEISKRCGFDFKFEKHNRDYVRLAGSNKMATFIVWFDSIDNKRSMIKVHINFLENIEFPVMERKLKSPTQKFPENDAVYFRDFLELYEYLAFPVYNIREIACEKVRTLLTRRTIKTRDVLDIYFIHKNFGVDVLPLSAVWVRKINFALGIMRNATKILKARQNLMTSPLTLTRGMCYFWRKWIKRIVNHSQINF